MQLWKVVGLDRRLRDQTDAACQRALIRATRMPVASAVEVEALAQAAVTTGRKSLCLSQVFSNLKQWGSRMVVGIWMSNGM